MFCFRSAIFDNLVDIAYTSHSKQIAQYILKNYKNSKIYMLSGWSDISPGTDIYLAKENVVLYDWYNRKRTSYESLRDIYKMTDKEIDFDSFYKNMDKEGIIATGAPIKAHRFLKNTIVIEQNNDYIIITGNKKNYYLKNITKSEDIGLFIYKPSDITSYGKIRIWN